MTIFVFPRFCKFPLSLFLVLPVILFSQTTQIIQLEQCYEWLYANHPVAKNAEYYTAKTELEVANISKIWYPQIQISAQASYQSDVTQLPQDLPGIPFEGISKDQYHFLSEFNQRIYDGGLTSGQIGLKEIQGQIQGKTVDVKLHELKKLVVEWYYGILLADVHLEQLDLVTADIDQQINQTRSGIQLGVVHRSNLDVLLAEKLQIEQQKLEIYHSRSAMKDMLALLTGRDFGENDIFQVPQIPSTFEENEPVQRTEIEIFALQKEALLAREEIRNASLKPSLSAFMRAGYSRPGLNFLSNQFDTYYIGGIKVSWPISNFYTDRNEEQLYVLERGLIENEEEAFHHDLNIQLRRMYADIRKYQAVIEQDQEIVELRNQVKIRSQAQYQNGVIRASEYLQELHAEQKAIVGLRQHELELSKTMEKINNLKGNTYSND